MSELILVALGTNMFMKLVLAATFVARSGGASNAEDVVDSDPVPAADPLFTWAGAFIGAHAG